MRRHRLRTASALAAAAVLAGTADARPSMHRPAPRVRAAGLPVVSTRGMHDLHLSQTRLVVDGATAAARIRVFEDDLILALTRAAQSSAAVPVTDDAALAYLRLRLTVRADGVLLAPTLGGSGAESDAQNQRVRWFLLTFRAATPVRALSLKVTPFFELYDDQQNLVTAVRAADGTRRSLLFRSGEPGEQGVRF